MPALRDGGPADAAPLAAFAARAFTDTFGHLYEPADLALFLQTHTPDSWTAELADSAYAVRLAEDRGAVAGYAKLGPPHLPFTPSGTPIELRQLYVDPAWHGRGVADALLEWAFDEARRRGADEIFLSVFVDNHRARRFYERHGFTAIGSYAFMVGTHADEDIVMRRAL